MAELTPKQVNVIKDGYRQAGVEFLSEKIKRIVQPIETDVGKALFNQTVYEIQMLIGQNTDLFLERMAETILLLAAKPQENENVEEKEEFRR
jgi:hypothetical protein